MPTTCTRPPLLFCCISFSIHSILESGMVQQLPAAVLEESGLSAWFGNICFLDYRSANVPWVPCVPCVCCVCCVVCGPCLRGWGRRCRTTSPCLTVLMPLTHIPTPTTGGLQCLQTTPMPRHSPTACTQCMRWGTRLGFCTRFKLLRTPFKARHAQSRPMSRPRALPKL